MSSVCIRSTRFGQVAILWSIYVDQPKILRVLLSKPGFSAKYQVSKLCPSATASSCSEIHSIADDIGAFLNGEDTNFALEMIRIDLCSVFQRKVLLAEYSIPRGAVSTYQRIASHLGNPKGARAVGNALATNPFPIIIPCHRAIRSDRSLGGYQGGQEMKRILLEMEGIDFDSTGRVTTEAFFTKAFSHSIDSSPRIRRESTGG